MRAVIYTEFGAVPTVQEVSAPDCPPGGVVIRVAATGLCRSDWHGWRGHDPDIALPHVPGHELAGTISVVGTDVRGWVVGDRVTVPFVCACGSCVPCTEGQQQVCDRQTQPGFTHWGSFAEYVGIGHADVNLVRLPDALEATVAASLGCRFATAYRALTVHGRIEPGHRRAVIDEALQRRQRGLRRRVADQGGGDARGVTIAQPEPEDRGQCCKRDQRQRHQPGAPLRRCAGC